MSVFKKHESLFLRAVKMRAFERKLLELAGEKKISGTVHTCIGQELIPLAMSAQISGEDYVFSNHRSHGHYLSQFDDYKGLALEILGHPEGVNHGVGGSQHLQRDRFFSSGIQGSMLGVALGTAYSQKEDGKNKIAVCYIGDGTFGEGILYEVLNIASKWSLPLLIVVENNHYAQSTPQSQTLAGSFEKRCEAFDVKLSSTTSFDLEDLLAKSASAIEYARTQGKPCVILVETYRLSPHSKGDDHRAAAELKQAEKNDLVSQFEEHLTKLQRESLKKEIEEAFVCDERRTSPIVMDEAVTAELYTEKKQVHKMGVRKAINEALMHSFNTNKHLVLWGEDVEDPYGGAFKVTQGLSTQFPARVKNTPISEHAIVSMGIGRALAGKPTIVEIMFSDFLGLAFDSLFNTASKIVSMFGERKKLPLIIRTANGANSGYGATHSQDMSSVFYGTPFLNLITPSKLTDYMSLYSSLVSECDKATIVFENKKALSSLSGDLQNGLEKNYSLSSIGDVHNRSYLLSPTSGKADVTIVVSSALLDEMERAMANMLDQELLFDVFVPEYLNILPLTEIEKSLKHTKKLLIIESVHPKHSWGAALWYQLSKRISFQGEIVGTPPAAIPSGLENEKNYFPDAVKICDKIKEIYELR